MLTEIIWRADKSRSLLIIKQVSSCAKVAKLNQVGGASFGSLSSDNQIAALKKIEDSPFFQKVRSTETVALYNNPEVWKHFGYPGASFPIGGYIHHGFNDVSWLPDPPASASPKPA